MPFQIIGPRGADGVRVRFQDGNEATVNVYPISREGQPMGLTIRYANGGIATVDNTFDQHGRRAPDQVSVRVNGDVPEVDRIVHQAAELLRSRDLMAALHPRQDADALAASGEEFARVLEARHRAMPITPTPLFPPRRASLPASSPTPTT
jgi:hypothetical protein